MSYCDRSVKMRGAALLVITTILAALTSCAHPKTKVFTTQDIDTIFLAKKLRRPIRVDKKTILVDARDDFQFAMLHAPQAVHVKWTDFTISPNSGVLKRDLTHEVQRLALLGISPQSNVVVLSGGRGTWPAAGRVAWSLTYIGMRDVQLVDSNALGLRYYNITPPPRPNAPAWQPTFVKRLLLGHRETQQLLAGKRRAGEHVLDVSSKPQIIAKLHAMKMNWQQFFNKNGRPSLAMKHKLNSNGFKDDDQIVVVSKRGVRSCAVAYALLAMGFRNVVTVPGGYNEF